MRNSLSRRQFLGAVGATLGFASIGTMNSLALSVENHSSGTLGFILPESKRYPQLASEMLEGMMKTLSKHQKVSRLANTTLDSLKTFARTNDTIISYASPSTAYLLRKRLADDSTRLLAADLGMDIQRFGEHLPQLSYMSLNYWQLAQSLALWVRESLGERLLIVADTYESGYDSFSLFESNFPQAKILFYEEAALSQSLDAENIDAVAFALSSEKAQKFIAEYEASRLALPLVRLPFVGSAIQSARPIYSASFAFDNSPFYTLGQRTAMVLQGQAFDETPILIKRANQTIAQYFGSQLPYHGINSLVKTGWTNSYPI